MRVAVLGATGYVGGRLVPELLAAGHEVRCLARRPERLVGVPWLDEVEVATADVLDRDSLDDAFADVDVVVYLIHAMGSSADFADADRIGARHAAEAAAAAGVSRIIYLGGLGEEAGAQQLSPHLESRHEVGAVLADGPVPVIELRAAIIIGSGSASFEMLRNLVDVLPVMVVPRWVSTTRCQPIAIADVLHHLVAAVEGLDDGSQVHEIGGPDVLTYREMMDRYAAVAGLRTRAVLTVPLLTPRLSSHWVNLVTPLPYALARTLVDSLVNDVVVDPSRDIRRVLDHEPLPLDQAIERALANVKDLAISTTWMDSARNGPAVPMPQDPDWAGGTVYDDRREIVADVEAEDLFAVVSGVGGRRGWYVAGPLWSLRGAIDKLVGGVGMRRGRRHPDDLRVGDALDFFRVEVLERPTLLRLRAEMKVPGDAWLEWRIEPTDDGRTRLSQLARFHPRGVAGRAYWWVLLPIHAVIWQRLVERLVDAAERRAAGAPPS